MFQKFYRWSEIIWFHGKHPRDCRIYDSPPSSSKLLFSFFLSADNFCSSLQSELAYPDASIHTSISDLNTACEAQNQTPHACWVGITKQSTEKWVTSKGRKVNLTGLWQNGQPVSKPFYDCAYLLQGKLYSQLCAG